MEFLSEEQETYICSLTTRRWAHNGIKHSLTFCSLKLSIIQGKWFTHACKTEPTRQMKGLIWISEDGQ